jgi:hypothetical protein
MGRARWSSTGGLAPWETARPENPGLSPIGGRVASAGSPAVIELRWGHTLLEAASLTSRTRQADGVFGPSDGRGSQAEIARSERRPPRLVPPQPCAALGIRETLLDAASPPTSRSTGSSPSWPSRRTTAARKEPGRGAFGAEPGAADVSAATSCAGDPRLFSMPRGPLVCLPAGFAFARVVRRRGEHHDPPPVRPRARRPILMTSRTSAFGPPRDPAQERAATSCAGDPRTLLDATRPAGLPASGLRVFPNPHAPRRRSNSARRRATASSRTWVRSLVWRWSAPSSLPARRNSASERTVGKRKRSVIET